MGCICKKTAISGINGDVRFFNDYIGINRPVFWLLEAYICTPPPGKKKRHRKKKETERDLWGVQPENPVP